MAGGKTFEIYVTDRALIRYLERVKGFNLDSHRRAIQAAVQSAALTSAATVTDNGFVYSLAHHPGDKLSSVTTVRPVQWKPANRLPQKNDTGRPKIKKPSKRDWLNDE